MDRILSLLLRQVPPLNPPKTPESQLINNYPYDDVPNVLLTPPPSSSKVKRRLSFDEHGNEFVTIVGRDRSDRRKFLPRPNRRTLPMPPAHPRFGWMPPTRLQKLPYAIIDDKRTKKGTFFKVQLSDGSQAWKSSDYVSDLSIDSYLC